MVFLPSNLLAVRITRCRAATIPRSCFATFFRPGRMSQWRGTIVTR
jgi:hypothetical protein